MVLCALCREVQSVVGSPPHKKANELKRQSSSSLIAQDIQVSHKRRCDSENTPSLDELARSKPEPLARIADKRDKSVSDPTKKVQLESTVIVVFLLN